uniref:NADH dehydrogenase subunit 5 n=1 Tax=Griffithsia okiensis TaxID=291168 RepID=UPI002E773F39|nr:NADH dehydrogenase subunit 5 [Griffithsia okiensis]WQF69545.1 NADH dehydrogenase subunit 5 [Griffithsia okiensis]
MYLITLILPLLGSLFSGFFGRKLGFYGSSFITFFCIFFSNILSFLIFYEIGFSNTKIFIHLNSWFESGIIKINWNFLFDNVTVTMLIVITTISTLVHLYSINYMGSDPHFSRFMSYLEIFTFFMLILVTSNNLIQMFLGWEGVGLSSYLLINFWNTRLSANRSALKALIVNRIGDFGLIFSIILIFYLFKSFNFSTIFSLVPFFIDYNFCILNYSINCITLIGVFLILGAVGKSAQLGLHTWLPDAMEGPTPVSALIHAATMVTAGVFLIIRFSPLLEFSSVSLFLLVFFGSLTAFFAALSGIFQHDLKKVIAYSTCSQLGYMVFCCGLSCYNVSLFHLTNHAFFKALLFLSAGSVIHAINDEQDMRKMGSLINFLPITYSLMLLGSFTLLGFPFLTGFYSKDLIIEISFLYRNNNIFLNFGSFACWLGSITTFLTAYYSFRLIFLTFINNSNLNKINLNSVFESSWFILVPLLILGIFSIFFGYFLKDFFVGLGTDSWNSSILIFPKNFNFLESEFLFIFYKWIPFLLSLIGFFIAIAINTKAININFITYLSITNFIFFLINKKWFFDSIYNKLIVFPILNFGYYISFKNLDRGFIELIGPFGFSILIYQLSNIFSSIQSGWLSHYIFYVILFTLIILNFFFLKISVYYIIFYFVLIFFI